MPSFIDNYMKYCEGYETPELYDLWSALSAMSALVSRRVWVDQGYFTIYGNLYVVLVGPPGGRKTSAMNVCRDILREVGSTQRSDAAMTKEALCAYMTKNCIKTYEDPTTGRMVEYAPMTLCLTELSHFLGTNSAHMIDFLTTIYDQEIYENKTKNKGDDVIPGPYLTILACTTPSNITRYLKEDVISGGFSRRTLFAFELDDGEPIPRPQVTPEAQACFAACVQWGKELENVRGGFVWHPEAITWYDKWYTDHFYSMKNLHDSLIKGYLRSKHVQLLKLAMLFSLSEGKELVLHKDYLLMALSALDRLEKGLTRVYEGMGRNELNQVSVAILNLLDAANKPIPEKEIFSVMYKEADTRELYSVIEHLKVTGKVIAGTFGDKKALMTPKVADRIRNLQTPQPPTP